MFGKFLNIKVMRNLVIITFFLALFLFSIPLFAQQSPAVKWGDEFRASSRSSLSDIVGHDNTGIYAIKIRGKKKYTLEHYDTNLSPTRTLDLDFEEEGIPCVVETILQLRNKLYLFTSRSSNRERKNTLSVQEINKKTLLPEPTKHRIAEIDFSDERAYNDGSFKVEVSRDSSRILVFYNLPYNKNEPEAFGITVLDDKLQVLWNKEVTLPYADGLLDVESFRVDNDGDVYLLALIYNEKRKSKRHGAPNFKYQVFAYTDKGNTFKEYPISLQDNFITDMQIEVLNNKNLICAGFYSQKGTFSIRGTYFLTVDLKSKEIKTTSLKEFGIDFITQNMKEREAEKTKRKEAKGEEHELYEYDLKRLLVGKDGSAILLGEQYFVTTTTHSNMVNGSMQTYTTTHYYYNDIIAVKIDPSGQIAWAEKIAKHQVSSGDDGFFSSYTLAIAKGKLCFIFNDNPKNLSYTGVGKVYNYNRLKESLVVVVTLDQAGKQKRQPLFSSIDAEVITRPKVCEQINNNEVILFGQRKKTQQFARVSL